jgi:tRNA1Val (adenine37-N6)-methyltransferase
MLKNNISISHLQFNQSNKGHRFSLDAVLLAQNIFPPKQSRILELGCGCGVISIIIASRFPDVQIIGIDIQKSQVAIARDNVRINNLRDRVTILEHDLRTLKGGDLERFHYIVCNPPFRKKSSGRQNVSCEKLIAREEMSCTLNDILVVSRKMLVNRGELNLIYPAGRIAEVMMQMRTFNINPTDLLPVYTKPDHPAKWGIVKGRLNSQSELTIHCPFTSFQSDHCL